MIELIHWSDLHYGSSDFKEEYLLNFIDYVNDHKPDAIICTGDFTDKARKSQYEDISKFLGKIKVPMINVIGNHDTANNGVIFFERYIGPRRSTLTLREKNIIIIGVRTPKDNTSEGELGDEQLEWLIQNLNNNKEKIKVLALHHHLIAVPSAGHKRTTLVDAGDVLQIAQEYKIDLILQGHRHVPHVWRLGDSTLLYCGTSTSDKVRGDDPPCFNQISLNKDKLEVYIVDSNNFKKKLLFSQTKDKINYVRQRNNKINHIKNSNVFQTII